MAHTNETTNLQLPQFVADDKATWLGDFNGAMQKIDNFAGTSSASIEGAVTNANSALQLATQATTTANSANNTATDAHTEAVLAEGIANNALNVANNTATLATALQTAQGDLTDLVTTDKTSLVNAINEVAQGGGSTPTASQVSYDNTDSGLSATDVQGAIDEVAARPSGLDRTVLWSNPNIDASFASQVVSVSNIDDYEEIEIVFRYGTSDNLEFRSYSLVQSNMDFRAYYISAGSSALQLIERRASRSNDSISFADCYNTSYAYGQSTITETTTATNMIPVAIIGHRYVGD